MRRKILMSTRIATILSITGALAVSSCGRKTSSAGDSSDSISAIDTTLKAENKIGNDRVIVAFGSNINDASYQCMVEVQGASAQNQQGQSWGVCAPSGLTVNLPVGSSVKVTIKAIDGNGNEDTSPLVLMYHGQAAALAAQGSVPADQGAGATVTNTPVSAQSHRSPIIPPPSNPGSHPQDGVGSASQWTPFPLRYLNLGSAWQFAVPDGMHVLQYSANNGVGTGVDVLQIMQGQDPNYFGIYPGRFWNNNSCSPYQELGIESPSGELLGYCAGKVQGRSQVTRMFGGDYAINHIEVGSDASAPIKKRMLVQVYDRYNPRTSVLRSLCANRPNVSGFNEIFGNMPVMQGFWAYTYLRDNVLTCRVTLNGLNGGRWQVAGFVYKQNDYVSSHCRSSACQRGQKALEVVYMEKNEGGMTRYSDYFARDFQELIYNSLGQENPYMPF